MKVTKMGRKHENSKVVLDEVEFAAFWRIIDEALKIIENKRKTKKKERA